jgi:hypothetical protein
MDVPTVIVWLSDDDPATTALASWKERLDQLTALDVEVKAELTRAVEAYLLSVGALGWHTIQSIQPLRLPYATVAFRVSWCVVDDGCCGDCP